MYLLCISIAHSGGASIKIWGGKGGTRKIFKGAKIFLKLRAKICHFYAEIVKFGLILNHLKIIFKFVS